MTQSTHSNAQPPRGAAVADNSVRDEELVIKTRQGDTVAFGELWRRHHRAARSMAAACTTLDVDDVVSESFTRILETIHRGRGPVSGFRSYLFVTIRNTAASMGRARREIPIDSMEDLQAPQGTEDAVLTTLDLEATTRAFLSLPERWQSALWYSEVEQMSPQSMAPLVGLKANSVAALTYRARDGLRKAWSQSSSQAQSAGV